MFIRSHLTFLSFNMTKMEANGFTATMQPAIESIYGNDEEAKKEAYARHQNFFNTHAVPFAFIAGLAYNNRYGQGIHPQNLRHYIAHKEKASYFF